MNSIQIIAILSACILSSVTASYVALVYYLGETCDTMQMITYYQEGECFPNGYGDNLRYECNEEKDVFRLKYKSDDYSCQHDYINTTLGDCTTDETVAYTTRCEDKLLDPIPKGYVGEIVFLDQECDQGIKYVNYYQPECIPVPNADQDKWSIDRCSKGKLYTFHCTQGCSECDYKEAKDMGCSDGKQFICVKEDSNRSIYIVGFTDSNLWGQNNSGVYDATIAKYDMNGNFIEGVLYGSTNYDSALGLEFSADEQTLYVIGFTSSDWFKNTTGQVCGFMISIQTNNLSLMNWGNQLCGSVGATEYQDLALDPTNSERIYTAGWTQGSMYAYGQVNAGNFPLADAFVALINASTGNINWVRLVGSPYDDRLFNVVVDKSGIAWAAGWSQPLDHDCLLVKFDSTGSEILERTFGTTQSEDGCGGIGLDGKGGAFLSGNSDGWLNSTGQLINRTNLLQPFVLHINSENDIVWLTQLSSTGNVTFAKLKVGPGNIVYVTGWSIEGDFDGHPEKGNVDIVYAAFTPDGKKLTSALLGSNELDQAFDLYVNEYDVLIVGITNSSWAADVLLPEDTVLVKTDSYPAPDSPSKGGKDNTALIAGLATGLGVLLVAAMATAMFFVFRRKNQPEEHATVEMSSNFNHVTSSSTYKDSWEIDYRKLERGKELGRGAFGVVYLATWRNSSVAVKQLDTTNTNAKTTANFLKEAQNVRNLRPHPNICTILGVCTNPEFPICIVMEYIPYGSLSDMLIDKKIELNPVMIVQFAKDIASGMGHLHAESILHCDLACRNLLVNARGSEYQIKISDFGLSRMLEATEYVSTTHNFPVKWSAPETLRMGKLSRASDVWSYGITLWEMVEERIPYPNMTNAQVPTELEKGYRLPKPTKHDLPDAFYQMMLKCWQEKPSERLSFEEISKELMAIEAQVPKQKKTENPSQSTKQGHYSGFYNTQSTTNNNNSNSQFYNA